MRRALPLLLAALALAGCPRQAPPTLPLDDAGCAARLADLFGDQSAYVVAVRPAVPAPLFTPEFLGTVNEITAAFEAAETAHAWAVRSLTTMPLIRPGPRGADLVTLREEMPLDEAGAAEAHALVTSLPFTVGDLVNAGETALFIHVPRANVEGVDVDALVDDLRRRFVERAMIAVHGTPRAAPMHYREVAGRGPSSDALLVSFTVCDGAEITLQDPAFLAALVAAQRRIEALPGVAGTYSLADDLMMTRRVLHRGDPGAFALPARRAEAAQLLLMYQMSGHAAEFGARISAGGDVAVMRVALTALDDEERAAALERVARAMAVGFPDGVEVDLCAP